jgi:multiple sugar transport system substrate-binding protein
MTIELQVALISGPAYDPLYASLPTFEASTSTRVRVEFTGDHPALNRHLSQLAEVPYDLVSTHTKYAPSQLRFLARLDDLLLPADLEDFVPLLLELARVDGHLFGIPRNIDVRLLHYRTDLISVPPQSWDELLDLARKHNQPPEHYGFVFPGRESGLFGTFFELAEMAGARLFPGDLVPDIQNEGGRWALGLLRQLYIEGLVPREIPEWHYDKVHECFRNGHSAMVGDWPGYYGLYRDKAVSPVAERFSVARYPVGPAEKSLAYGGGHTFALTRTGINKPEARELLMFLTDAERQLIEARNGCVPVRRSVMRQIQSEADGRNGERLSLLEDVIANHILVPPKFARYPEVEDVLWHTVQKAFTGELQVDEALHRMTEEIKLIVSKNVDRSVISG